MTYIEPDHPVVLEALKQHAARIAAGGLAPILDAAEARGMSYQRAHEIAKREIQSDCSEGLLDRISAALDSDLGSEG
jgi:hypothetical protein